MWGVVSKCLVLSALLARVRVGVVVACATFITRASVISGFPSSSETASLIMSVHMSGLWCRRWLDIEIFEFRHQSISRCSSQQSFFVTGLMAKAVRGAETGTSDIVHPVLLIISFPTMPKLMTLWKEPGISLLSSGRCKFGAHQKAIITEPNFLLSINSTKQPA
jgi:hypothetical protein